MNSLITTNLCDPDRCPIADNCPVGPIPGLDCRLRQDFTTYIEDQVTVSFKEMDSVPLLRARVDLLLKPLLEQYLHLRMAQSGHSYVVAEGKINPLYSEIRQTITSLNKLMTDLVSSSKEHKKSEGFKTMTTSNYYDMLLVDGKASVEDTVGPSVNQPNTPAVINH